MKKRRFVLTLDEVRAYEVYLSNVLADTDLTKAIRWGLRAVPLPYPQLLQDAERWARAHLSLGRAASRALIGHGVAKHFRLVY